MKRILSEWGFILSVGMFLALAMLYGISPIVDQTTSHFLISTTGGVWHDIHLLAGNGDIWFFNQSENDSSGKVQPLVVDLRTHLAPKDGRIRRYTLPGFDLEYCRFTAFNDVAWSLKMSLLYPAVVTLVGAVLFLRLRLAQRTRKILLISQETRPR